MIQISRASVMSIARARARYASLFSNIFVGALVRAPALTLVVLICLVGLAARAISQTPDAISLDTSFKAYRARGTIRAKRAAAVLVAARQSSKTPLDSRETRRRLLEVYSSANASSASQTMEKPSMPPSPPSPPSPPPPPPYAGLPPARRLSSALDAMLLGLRPKSGVDGGRGLGEFHVIVSQTASRTVGEVVDLFRRACVIEHSIENAAGYNTVCRRRGGDEGSCASTFSALNIGFVYELIGLLDVLEGFQTLGEGSEAEVAARLAFIRDRCAYSPFTRESVNASHADMCRDVRACHLAPCVHDVVRDARCMIGEYKIGMCDFMTRVDPTIEETLAVANIKKRFSVSSCLDIDERTVEDFLDGVAAALRWSQSWTQIEAFGAPFEILLNDGFLSVDDRLDAPKSVRLIFRLVDDSESVSWVKDVAHHVVEGFNDDVSSKLQGVSVTWSHARAYSSIIDDELRRDCNFAIAAMCVTIALITIKTRSIIIGIGGALSIAGAAIFTHATYFCIYGRRWFGTLHLAGLFLSIGIGADDVFVIHDHWTHSEKEVPSRERLSDTLEDRLRWTLSRSGFTMGITSATTAAAFASNIPSAIPPIRLFGMYMMSHILFLLGVSVVVTSACIILNEKWKHVAVSRNRVVHFHEMEDVSRATASFRRGSAQRRATIDLAEFPTMERIIHRRGLSTPIGRTSFPDFTNEHRPLMAASDSSGSTSGSTSPTPLSPAARASRRRDALKDLFARLCRWKWTILALTVINLAVATFIGRNITKRTGDESLSLWPKDHVIHRYSVAADGFASSQYEESVMVQFTFGLDALNTRADDDPKLASAGTPSWVSTPNASYDFSDPSSQRWLLNFCDELKSDAMSHRVLSPTMVNCWMHDLHEWLRNGGMANAHADGLPIARDAFQDAVRTFVSHINPYAILRFLSSREECDRLRPNDALCTAFSAVTIKTVTRRLSSTANVEREHEFWDAWLREKIRDTSAPAETRGAFQSSDTWVVTDTVTELKSVAALTVVYSLALSFIVLFACTWSPRVAAMATFCIASVVVYFVAFMTLQGWRLGIIEAVCVQVIVGLSVDYISHVAVAYVSTREKFMTRDERALASVRTVGGAVTAGWFSSVAAASCLFGCTIVFFSKFAAFVTVTLTTSFAHAVFVLPLALAALGPAFVGDGTLTASFRP